ncbi:MAG TPA: ParA family protein [Burkholderiaceae bacterium]|nr:ParA family protein [Burkholderiaceae bacterium]HQR69002.1 ParA family protein [Burkholderiaceae bacterium]
MPIYLVANPKGGAGKSTVATNLAGYFARQGHATMLGDLDRQQSALAWLGVRPDVLPRIQSWDRSDEKVARPPKGVTHVVLDTPAGLHGHALRDAIRLADRVIIPVQPSLFDILATQSFLGKLADRGVLDNDGRVGVLGMRVDARTRAAEQLQRFVEQLEMPVLGFLRDTQNYVQLAAHGLTLWDVAPSRVERDLEQWQSVIAWVEG